MPYFAQVEPIIDSRSAVVNVESSDPAYSDNLFLYKCQEIMNLTC